MPRRTGSLGLLAAVQILWIVFLLCPAARCEEVQFFILWGASGRWDGSLTVRNGRILAAEPYSFEEHYGDKWLGADERRASWRSGVGNGLDGVQIVAQTTPETAFVLDTPLCKREFKWDDIPQDRDLLIPIKDRTVFVVLGRGTTNREPRLPRSIPLPPLFRLPKPDHPVSLPDDWAAGDQPVVLRFAADPPGPLSARRVSRNDGRLYIEVGSRAGPLSGDVRVVFAGREIGSREVPGSLWLSLKPRIGVLTIRAFCPSGESTLTVPASLVETRGSKLYLNGEPFLVKGTLPRNLNDADARYLKSLCANTVRSRYLDYLDKYGFMGIIMIGRGPGLFCQDAKNDAEFREKLRKYLRGYRERCEAAARNPRTLIIQHANEQAWGPCPWTGRLVTPKFDRLDYLLARCYNIAKPIDPMLPNGYSNCALGYRAPDFLDVYLHNTYLSKDRNWPPLTEFMKFQGCDRRPYIHTEFGANVYMPQAYLRAPNSPVFEKIHAWNYPNRWKTYLAAGTIGGTNYCFYDYDYSKVNVKSWDKGYTNFGVMTFDRKPKLACWELWHLWRDFEIAPEGDGKLRVRYLRDYHARDCRLTIRNGGSEEILELDDFSPKEERTIQLGRPAESFRWRMDYTTHSGLAMTACGAYPPALEAEDFLARLKSRKTYPFLRELLDAEVLAADGRRDVTTLKEMEREDGVVAVAFRKPKGVAYLTVFTRMANGPYLENAAIDVAFKGRVEAVDEMTGQPTGDRVVVEETPNGLRLKNLRVPLIPASYTQRSHEPLKIPVFRITPRSFPRTKSLPVTTYASKITAGLRPVESVTRVIPRKANVACHTGLGKESH